MTPPPKDLTSQANVRVHRGQEGTLLLKSLWKTAAQDPTPVKNCLSPGGKHPGAFGFCQGHTSNGAAQEGVPVDVPTAATDISHSVHRETLPGQTDVCTYPQPLGVPGAGAESREAAVRESVEP